MASEASNSAATPGATITSQAGLGAGPAVNSLKVTAIKPEETLAPLRALWSTYGDTPRFYDGLAQYARVLTGAVSVSFFEQVGENPASCVAMSSAIEDRRRQREYLPATPKLKSALASLNSERYEQKIGNRSHAALLTPYALRDGKKVCLVAVLPPERSIFVEPCFVILHLITQFLVQRELLISSEENTGAFQQATMLVEMFSRTNEAANFPRALFTLSNELEKFFGCRRVAMGTGDRRSCRIQAVSGMSSEDRKGIGISQLSEAMREAIALEKIMVWPSNSDLPEDVVVSANHDDLLHSYRAGSLLIAPFYDHNEESVGAIALLWPTDTPPNKKSVRLLEASRPHLASLTSFLKKSKPGRIRGALGKLWQGTLMKRLALVLTIVGAIGSMFIPITYRLPAECRIEPVLRRSIAAPFDAILYRAYAKPGELVKNDQILAELEGREIRVQLAEAIASRSAAVKKRDTSMVMEDPSNFQMAQLEADRLNLEVQRLQFRSENLIIRSPLEGVVLTGNLERSEGVPVSLGQKLFEVAPLNKMLLEIFIPEGEVRYLSDGATVKMRLESDATRVWESSMERIHPVSEIYEGKNVFIAESELTNSDGSLRPGMRGSVRIMADPKPIGWILFHKLWDYIRLKLW